MPAVLRAVGVDSMLPSLMSGMSHPKKTITTSLAESHDDCFENMLRRIGYDRFTPAGVEMNPLLPNRPWI
jgi:hypothetical protein